LIEATLVVDFFIATGVFFFNEDTLVLFTVTTGALAAGAGVIAGAANAGTTVASITAPAMSKKDVLVLIVFMIELLE
jgi:hypothetical protein